MQIVSIIVFFVAMCIYLRCAWKKNNNTISIVLIALYTFSVFASIFLYQIKPYRFEGANLFSYIYLFLTLIISFSPITRFRQNKYIELRLMPIKTLNTIIIFFVLMYIPVLIDLTTKFASDFRSILLNFALASEAYANTAEMVQEQTGSSFEHIPEVIRGITTSIVIFIAFYYLAYENRNKYLTILIWVCLFVPIPSSLLSASRTGLSYWVLDVLCVYLLLNRYYNDNINSIIKKVMAVFACALVFIFSVLTIGRFGESEYNASNDVGNSVVDYFGQSTLNFSSDVLQNDVYQWGDGTLPFFRQMMGLSSSDNIYARQQKWGHLMKIEQGAFYTYIGDMVNDFSPYFAFVLIVLLSIWFDKRINFNNRKIAKTSQLYLFFLLATICFEGLFYYSYKTVGGNLKLIANFLFYIFLLNFEKSSVLKKQNSFK